MKLVVLVLLAVWFAFGCGSPPTPKEVREASACAALASNLTVRLQGGQDCAQARDEALAEVKGCPLPVHCPGDELE